MPEEMAVAVAQVSSTDNPSANIDEAIRIVEAAARAGARVVALPENVNYLGPDAGYREVAESVPGPTIERFAQTARKHHIYLLAGSVIEAGGDGGRFYNTSVLLDPSGRIIAKYRKIHLFDVSIGDEVNENESRVVAPGNEIVTAAIDGHVAGLSICYDVRFPELYRELASRGAEIVFVPAAFTMLTGKDHWEVLLRARAIENQCFVIAPGQFGRYPGGWNYGRSLIIDPWGTKLVTVPDEAGFAIATLDFRRLRQIRQQIPALANRRLGRPAEATTPKLSVIG